MRLVFMGTPEFAATILEDVIVHHEVVAVYTRPDAVRGRGKELEVSPVKRVALEYDIPVFSPASFTDSETVSQLSSFKPDVICVAAFGVILPKAILELPRYGCLNVHASLLPRWRGAAPVERSILADDVETGVCIMRMEEGLDTGAYCVCRTASIEEKKAEELSDELANLGSHALLTALVHIEAGAHDWTEQDETRVTYADKLKKGELYPLPSDSAREAVLKVRASSAAHPSRCIVAGKRVSLEEAKVISDPNAVPELSQPAEPGAVLFVKKKLFLRARDGFFEVVKLKPDGKRSMDAKAFVAGIPGIKNEKTLWGPLDV